MASFNRILQKLSKAIFKGFFVFGTITFAFLLVILFYNVISRNFLGGAVSWIEEFSRFVFTWMMFLGISIGVYYKKHLGVDFIAGKYPGKVRSAVLLISDILTFVLFLVLTIYGFIYCANTMRMLSSVMGVPYGLVYLCVPLCGIFSMFYCFAGIIDRYFGEGTKGGEAE